MKESNGTYTASLPTDKTGDMFYYIEVKTNKETVTKPYTKSEPIVLNIDDGKVKGEPDQITITPDTKQGGLRFSWLTDPAVTKTVIQYKVKGTSKWESKSGTSYVESVTAGYKEKAAHRARAVHRRDLRRRLRRIFRSGAVLCGRSRYDGRVLRRDKFAAYIHPAGV